MAAQLPRMRKQEPPFVIVFKQCISAPYLYPLPRKMSSLEPQIRFARMDDLGFHWAMNKTLAACFVFLLMAFGAGSPTFGASVSDPIPLWPKGAPDEKGES